MAGYGLALAATTYFAWSAWHGERGLMARQHYEQQIASREALLATLTAEKDIWLRRVSLLDSEHIDKDMLEERAARCSMPAIPTRLWCCSPSPKRPYGGPE